MGLKDNDCKKRELCCATAKHMAVFIELWNCPFLNLPLSEVKSKRVQNCLNCHRLKNCSCDLYTIFFDIFLICEKNKL